MSYLNMEVKEGKQDKAVVSLHHQGKPAFSISVWPCYTATDHAEGSEIADKAFLFLLLQGTEQPVVYKYC